jgi:hypothetical protein
MIGKKHKICDRRRGGICRYRCDMYCSALWWPHARSVQRQVQPNSRGKRGRWIYHLLLEGFDSSHLFHPVENMKMSGPLCSVPQHTLNRSQEGGGPFVQVILFRRLIRLIIWYREEYREGTSDHELLTRGKQVSGKLRTCTSASPSVVPRSPAARSGK